jgi:acyl-CoA synthetase (AMP-forming)/AMP-acid ligase II
MSFLHSLSFADVCRENRRGWPQRTAIVDGDVRLTYAEFDERTSRLANVLTDRGVSAGDHLIWIGQNSFRILEVLLAAAKIGAVLCVANWRQTEAELAWILDDWAPEVVFWESLVPGETEIVAGLRSGSRAEWIECKGIDPESYEGRIRTAPTDDRELAIDPAGGLVALYTGAFDGKPQAAILSHEAVIAHNMVVALQRRAEAGAFTFLSSGPLFHVGTMMWLTATFHLGGTNVLMPKFDAEEACRLIEAEQVQSMFAMPMMLDELARVNADCRYDLSSLEVNSQNDQLRTMVSGDTSPWGRLIGGYGQTEAGGMITYAGLGGRASPLLHVRILDDEGAEVPTGEVGEIAARGLHVMNGYYDRDELTASRQRHGWHHTGDLGRRESDGTITFIGPKQRMIKSAGENIYVAEVQQALITHEEIVDVAVIGVPDPEWGQCVKAIVVRSPGSTLDEAGVVAYSRKVIASYKKPRQVVFADAIPRNGYVIAYDALDAEYGGGGYPGSH